MQDIGKGISWSVALATVCVLGVGAGSVRAQTETPFHRFRLSLGVTGSTRSRVVFPPDFQTTTPDDDTPSPHTATTLYNASPGLSASYDLKRHLDRYGATYTSAYYDEANSLWYHYQPFYVSHQDRAHLYRGAGFAIRQEVGPIYLGLGFGGYTHLYPAGARGGGKLFAGIQGKALFLEFSLTRLVGTGTQPGAAATFGLRV